VIESYSDGSGQNSLGHGSASFIIVKDNYIIYQETNLLEGKTNNEAEYLALTSAVSYLLKEGYKDFKCYVDSELIYKQLRGDYKTSEPSLVMLKDKLTKMIEGCHPEIGWVPRTNKFIQVADKLNRKATRMVSR
jgi:ribonuclease HI